MRILLVEDDINLSNDIAKQLNAQGVQVDVANDGIYAERLIRKTEYDCILADVSLPGKNGYELVKSIRAANIQTAIIMVTAFGEIDDKLKGFDNGADDYITKPFFFEELMARIKVVVRRSQNLVNDKEHITFEDLAVDMKKREVKRKGQVVKLSSREFAILTLLANSGENIVSKKEILNKVWGSSLAADGNIVEVYINLLRNKIDKNHEVKLIKTRIGFGYYLGKD